MMIGKTFYLDSDITTALIEALKTEGDFKIEKLGPNYYAELRFIAPDHISITHQHRQDGKPFKRLRVEAVPKQEAILITRQIKY